MTPRQAQIVTALVGMAFLLAAAIILVLPTDGLGPLRWGIGIPLLLAGLVNVALIPRYSRETLPSDDGFSPLGSDAGSELVRRLATVLDHELRDTPHQVEVSTDSVRISYASGTFRQPGARTLRDFTWRTTLTPTTAPDTFIRLDQAADRERGLGWGKVSVQSGLRWGGAVRVTVGPNGTVTKQAVKTSDVTSAIDAALKQTGARLAFPTAALAGILTGAAGVLIGIGAAVGALLM